MLLLAGLACQDDANLPTSPAYPSPDADVAAAVVPVSMIVSGDMHAACNNFNKAKATAPLVESRPGGTYAVLRNHERNIDPTADAY